VQGISCNSKLVKNNSIFVAIKGNKEDGHRFIQEAIERGAKAVIVQTSAYQDTRTSGKISFIRVKDTRRALAKLVTKFYANPSSKIKVIGITGTNGKTTVSYLIESILREAGFNPAVIGTINYRFQDKVISSTNTTPGPIELQSMLAEMLEEGINYAIIEVSSHALHQDRTEGITFHSAIFTNLTQDHLDYHKTKANYFRAKSKLFSNLSQNCFAIINNDDAYGIKMKRLTKAKIITYGINSPADIQARDISFNIAQTEFTLKTTKGQANFKTRLIGRHNVYNILASIAFALSEGLSLEVIKSAIERFNFVPGRLERINANGGFSVFVDYAHTEDALRNVIQTLRQLSQKRIIVVFGCGGERDKTKRPKMGYVVSELADYAIITSDNPRSEDPNAIINDIKSGINKDNYCIIPQRQEAIIKSLSLAKSGDIILVAGKGHENYQILKDKVVHFDDRQVIRECLKLMNY
jgi:UDP-N-acetylmuramoyl-L-alanyl-D-glutamate--2,6-diaminopimelate ligase